MELSNVPNAVIPGKDQESGLHCKFQICNFLLVLTNIYLFGSIVLRETWLLWGAVLTYILTPLFLFQAIYKFQFLE